MYEGILYPSSEHAYQAAKTTDHEIRKQCLNMTCGQAKRWGRTIPLREDWEDIKLQVMYDICKIKFNSYPNLRKMLIETASHELIEGNTWGDRYWGQVNHVGENHLGKILMALRIEYMLDE